MSTPAPLAIAPELVHAGPSATVATGAGTPIRQTNLWKDAWYRYIRNRAAVVAGAVFVAMVALLPRLAGRSRRTTRTTSSSRRPARARASSIPWAPTLSGEIC